MNRAFKLKVVTRDGKEARTKEEPSRLGVRSGKPPERRARWLSWSIDTNCLWRQPSREEIQHTHYCGTSMTSEWLFKNSGSCFVDWKLPFWEHLFLYCVLKDLLSKSGFLSSALESLGVSQVRSLVCFHHSGLGHFPQKPRKWEKNGLCFWV